MNDQQPILIPEEIREFLEGLFQETNLMVRDSVKEKMMQELFIELDLFMRTEVAKQLPEDALSGFSQLISTNPPLEQVRDYLEKHIPNVEEVFSQAFEAFRQLYLRSNSPVETLSPMLEEIAQG